MIILLNLRREEYATNKFEKRREKIIRTKREKICHEVVFVLFIIYAFTLLYPFLFLLINSLKSGTEEIQTLPFWFPVDIAGRAQRPPRAWDSLPTLWNPLNWKSSSYQEALNHKSFSIGLMFWNTIKLSVGQTFVSMALTCMAHILWQNIRLREIRSFTLSYWYVPLCPYSERKPLPSI